MRTLLALLLCSAAWGADLKLVASPATAPAANTPVPLDAGKFIFLSIPDYAGDITFDPPDSPLVSMFPVAQGLKFPGCKQGDEKAGEHTVPVSKSTVYAVYGEKAGVLTVSAWGVTGSKAVKISTITIAVGGARPPPKPDPDDDKRTKPEPTGEGAWVVVVEETSARIPNTIKLLRDKAFWDSLDAKGHCTRFYDKDSPDIPKGAYNLKDKLPILLIISKGGKELYRGEITPTTTTAGIAKTVTEVTGK